MRGWGAGRLLEQSIETPAQDLAHHAVVVPGRELFALDVECPIMRFHETGRTGDNHRPDRIRPHYVAVVVNFDAAYRSRAADRLTQKSEKLRLACGVREFAAERLAPIVERGLDQLALFAALRHRDFDAMAGALTECFGE